MNTDSVVEFFENVPLLHRLTTSSSPKRIAQVAVFRRYKRGEYVVRRDEEVEGVYFIFQGQVLGSAGEHDSSELLLKQFDFFGRGIFGNVYSADGDINIPIIYEVNRLRDGNNFATRRVDARQKGKTMFTLVASFQRDQQGFDHQESNMPHMPHPDSVIVG